MFYGVIVDPSKKDPVAYVPSPDGDMLLYVSRPSCPFSRWAPFSPPCCCDARAPTHPLTHAPTYPRTRAPALHAFRPLPRSHISTCCLDPQKAKKNSGVRATLMVKSGGDEQAYAVCTLREGGTESIAVDLAMEEYAEFTVVGNCPIHLTGYYMPLDEDDEDDEDDEGLMPGYGDDGDSDNFDMDFDDDPALLGYDASGLPIYDGEGGTDDDDEEDADSDSDSDSDGPPPGGNVLEIKDITDGAGDDSEEDDDSEDDDDSEEDGDSGASEDEEPAHAQKKQKPEPKTEQKPAAAASKVVKKDEPVSETKTKAKKYPNGFEIHELKQGKASGKVAKAGKRVTMKYVGKLQKNGKVFDQTKGNATFKFRLGVGEVIKGWDRGVEGMRVGDRRKLVCPPSMAYGSSRTGPIPPNSTLVFEVELVDVR
jgi:FK506-binding nuclear protein